MAAEVHGDGHTCTHCITLLLFCTLKWFIKMVILTRKELPLREGEEEGKMGTDTSARMGVQAPPGDTDKALRELLERAVMTSWGQLTLSAPPVTSVPRASPGAARPGLGAPGLGGGRVTLVDKGVRINNTGNSRETLSAPDQPPRPDTNGHWETRPRKSAA